MIPIFKKYLPFLLIFSPKSVILIKPATNITIFGESHRLDCANSYDGAFSIYAHSISIAPLQIIHNGIIPFSEQMAEQRFFIFKNTVFIAFFAINNIFLNVARHPEINSEIRHDLVGIRDIHSNQV